MRAEEMELEMEEQRKKRGQIVVHSLVMQAWASQGVDLHWRLNNERETIRNARNKSLHCFGWLGSDS